MRTGWTIAGVLTTTLVLAVPAAVESQEMDNAVFHYSRFAFDVARSPGPAVGRGRAEGWIGTDFDRLWWSTTGERAAGTFDEVEAMALYGRYVRMFWDVVVGYRQDIEPATQSYLAFGVRGLAPYWFDVSLLGFVSDRGKPSARFAMETDLYLTQRLVLQPFSEVDLLITRDDELDVGSGARRFQLGARARYDTEEVRAIPRPHLGPREGHLHASPWRLRHGGLRLGAGVRLVY